MRGEIPDGCVFQTLCLQFATTGWNVGQPGYGLSTQVPYLCTIKFCSFVLIAYRIAEDTSQFVSACRIFLCMKLSLLVLTGDCDDSK